MGAMDVKSLGKNALPEEKESKQYMTLQSMQKNLHKVCGVTNDFLAKMLFVYISEHAPESHIINFHQFFARLHFFWPKKANN